MDLDWTISTKLFAALFAIMNPLSTIPVFLALSADEAPAERRKTMLAMLATVVIGSLLCALIGQALLSIFGIDMVNFRLAGGILVLVIALSMLSGDDHPSQQGTPAEQVHYPAASNPGVYPLGLPITLGPGSMATIIVFSHRADQVGVLPSFYAGLVGYLAFFGVLLAAAPAVGAHLSPTVLSISKRVMGIVLAAVAVEMMASALGELFPGWKN